jgi:hypothetical protein
MQTFTLDPSRWWIARIFGRNPLLRGSDRIEALAAMAAIVVSLLMIPFACAAGTAFYDNRTHLYSQEARTRHAVIVPTKDPVKTGEANVIWVDTNGNRVDPPTPVARASFDGVSIAVSSELVVIWVMGSLFAAVRWQLDRIRDAALDREIESLATDDGRSSGTGRGRPQ